MQYNNPSTSVPPRRLITLNKCCIKGNTLSCHGSQYDGAEIYSKHSDPTPGWIRVTLANSAAPGVIFRVKKICAVKIPVGGKRMTAARKNPCGCASKDNPAVTRFPLQNGRWPGWAINPRSVDCPAGSIRSKITGNCNSLTGKDPAVVRLISAQAQRQMYRNMYRNPISQQELMAKARRSAAAGKVRRAIDRQFGR